MGIASGPIYAAGETVFSAEKVRVFVARAIEVSRDGLSVSEFSELLFALLRISVAAADSFPADGAEKRQWVLSAVGILFDEVADRIIPAYAYPFWVMFRPAFRALTLRLAAGAIETILPLVRSAE